MAMHAPAVEFDHVTYRYSGSGSTAVPALQDVCLKIEAGERLGILGPNGGGKSTMLKLMLGLLDVQHGNVRVQGSTPTAARRSGIIGYVSQRSGVELAAPISVDQLVSLGATWRLSPFGGVPKAIRMKIDRMLDLTGSSAYRDKPIGELSGGQLQRALIARALCADSKILALDEPTVGIDPAGQRRFAELLDTIHRELNLTIIVVSHDLRAIAAGCDRVACLASRLHSHMSPRGLTPQVLAELFSHDIAGLAGELSGLHVHTHAASEACPVPLVTGVGLTVEGQKPEGSPRANG